MALLAIVIGAIFGLRAGFGPTTPDTQVAGNVIERSEAAEPTEPAASPDDDPIVIPIPSPQTDDADDADTADDTAIDDGAGTQTTDEDEPAEPAVGIIRDTPAPVIPADTSDDDDAADDDDDDDDEAPAAPRPDRTPSEEPEPTTPPRETDSPSPSPEPADVALRTGEGHSRDTALAEDGGWLFREVSGHGGQGQDSSREAQARLVVGFDDGAKQGSGPTREFQCRAWLTAGEGRLTTDDDHVFEIALLALDADGNVAEAVTAVIERHAYDLGPGETTAAEPMTTTPVELDAADGIDYTCAVRYQDR